MDEMNEAQTPLEAAEDTDPFDRGFGETEDTGEEQTPGGEEAAFGEETAPVEDAPFEADPAETAGVSQTGYETAELPQLPFGASQLPQPPLGTLPFGAQTGESAMQEDIRNFRMVFPEAAMNPRESIPPQVWQQVDRGMSLTAAYAQYAVAQARGAAHMAEQQNRILRQNQDNRARSTGSMRSAGEEIGVKDPFLEGWNN